MPYQENLQIINRLNRGIRVVEYEPGRRLVIRKRLRFRLFPMVFRIIGSLALLGGSIGFISDGAPWPASVIMGLVCLTGIYLIWGVPVLTALMERVVVDEQEGLQVRKMELFSVQKFGYSASDLMKKGKGRVIWTVGVRRTEGSGKNKTTNTYLEFWARFQGKKESRLYRMHRPKLKWARVEAEALNEMLTTFNDTFRKDYAFTPDDVDDAV